MGQNFSMAGYSDVEAMVAAASQSEDNQLGAFGSFIIASKLNQALQIHDWTAFARGYNGPNFAINHYDTRLNGEFQRFSSGHLPDLLARAVQLYLIYLGFSPGPVDGIPGSQTLSALAQCQSANGLPVTTTIDDNVVAEIQNLLPPV